MLIVADTRRSALEKEGTSHADSRCARVFRGQFSRNDVTCPCGTKAKSEKRIPHAPVTEKKIRVKRQLSTVADVGDKKTLT